MLKNTSRQIIMCVIQSSKTIYEVKMDQIIKVAWELNENTDNRYKLVYEIAELAKKLVDEMQMKKARDEFGFEEAINENAYKKENPVEHAIMVKASETDDTELVG